MPIMQLRDDLEVAAADRERGHRFQPPNHIVTTMPPLRDSHGGPTTIIRLHYWLRGRDWWLSELDPETMVAFGYVHLGNPTEACWQTVKLAELAVLKVGSVFVQRDVDWQPARFDEIPRALAILRMRDQLEILGDGW